MPLSYLLHSTAVKLGVCVKMCSSAYEVFITGVLARCVAWPHTFSHHITTTSLFRRLNLLGIGSYYENQILRWASHR